MVGSNLIVVVLASVFIVTQGLNLPSYLPACYDLYPEFDSCAKASFKAALPHLIVGDPEYRVPILDPIDISEIKVISNQLNIELQNAKVYGLGQINEFDEFHWDKNESTVTAKISIPKDIPLPITGNGKFDFKFDNLFNNKQLSENMNKLLNENWETVLNDIGEAIPIAIEAVFRSVADGIFSKISV